MANNYNIHIKSQKLTQNVAAEIFNYISTTNNIINFNYRFQELKLYIRGYVDLQDILKKYNFDNTDFTEIMDEFNFAYFSMDTTDKTVLAIKQEIENDIKNNKYTIWEYKP